MQPPRKGKRRDEIDALVTKYKRDKDGDSDSETETPHPKKIPFVDWFSFNLFVGFVIALNAFTIGLETDARAESGDSVSGMWFLFEVLYALFFLWELLCRLYYHRMKYFTGKEKWWNLVDCFIVTLSVVDCFIITPIGLGGKVRFVSMMRFVRLIRLIRLIRLMRLFKELWLVANGLIQSGKTLCWVALMIIIFLYICSIYTTLEIGKKDDMWNSYYKQSGGWDHEKYFKTVPRSMFTLFQVVTLEQWSENIVRHVMVKQPWMVPFFMVVIAITTFGLLNIVVGVIVENTLATSERDDNKIKRSKERDRQRVFNHLREIFEAADEDGSGTLNLAEVRKAINKPEIYNKLKMIEFPVDDPEQIFMLLDFDGSGHLNIDEFITGCIRMKGTAKSKDLLVAQVAVDTMKRHYTQFEKEMRDLQQKIMLLEETAKSLVDQGEHVFLNLREYRMRHQDLELRGSSPPRISTGTISKAPWEESQETSLLKLTNQDTGSLFGNGQFNNALTDGFAKPDNWAIVEFDSDDQHNNRAINDATRMPAITEGNRQPMPTNDMMQQARALQNGSQPALTNSPNQAGRAAVHNGSQNEMLALQDQRRGNRLRAANGPPTDLALPGSMN